LAKSLQLEHLTTGRIYAYRSTNSKTRAYARIWGLSYLWQKTLKVPPTYIVEVLSEHYDDLPDTEKDKVLLHELTHIPKNFSGALVPHIRHGKRSFHRKVDELISRYFMNKSNLD
jgi:predicted metallopeptidase